MLRREHSKLQGALRRHAGAGIYQYGAGIYQYGAGTSSYGGFQPPSAGGVTPYGGYALSKVPLRRMGGAGIAELFKKGVKKIKSYFKKEGPAIAKSLASTAASAAMDYSQGKSITDIGKSLGTQALDKASAVALSRVPEALKPVAEVGIKKARSKTGLGTSQYGGTAPLRAAQGELSAGQLKYLKRRADRKPNDATPVFDRHELQMFGNIIQGKQIIGSGMKQ